MDKLVILGANESVNKLIIKAKELNFETHVFAWKAGDVGEYTADYFYPVSIDKKEEVLDLCKKIKPKGITSITTDFAVETVNYVGRNLGLISNSRYSDNVSRNKYHMREAFKSNGLKVPKYRLISNVDDLAEGGYNYPLIVKPTDRWSSKGVSKVYNFDELTKAISNAIKFSIEKKAIVEEFISGVEYSAECISYNGEHKVLTLTKKFTTGSPNYIEIGHMQPVELEPSMIKKIHFEIFEALNALQINHGASHVEFKVNNEGDFGIIEIGARMGGDCIGTDLVQLSTGFDYIKMVIEIATGQQPTFEISGEQQVAIVRFFLNEDDVNSYKIIKDKYPKYIKFSSDLSNVKYQTITDSSTRLGYFIIGVDPSDTVAVDDIKKMCSFEGECYE